MVMGGLELGRRDHPDLAVESTVIEPVDVLESLELDVIEAAPRSPVNQLGLVQAVEGFGKRVVVRVAARANRGDHSSLCEALGKLLSKQSRTAYVASTP